jgi:glutathione S-transferase
MLTLYVAPGTCALASLIALEEAGATYRAVKLDFAAGEQRGEAYRRVNPKGRVPALATERGILTETPAILAYVAQSFPAAGLAPLDDPFAFAELQAFNSYLCSTVHVNHAHRPRGSRWADEEASLADMKRKVPETMTAAFRLIEDDYLKGPWVLGEHYSAADGYLFTLANWLEGDGVDVSRLPRVMDHRVRMAARPAVQRALAAERGKG